MRWLGGCLAAILMAGCATASFTAVSGKLALLDQGLDVSLPEGWYRAEAVREALLLTRDGPQLQFIYLQRVSLDKELSHTKRKFARGMLPRDAVELEAENLRANQAAIDFGLLEKAPVIVAGQPGFRLVYTWKTKEGLRLKAVHYGVLHGNGLYRLIYQAAARHYFDRDLETFERVRESFRLLGDQGLSGKTGSGPE